MSISAMRALRLQAAVAVVNERAGTYERHTSNQ